MDKELTLNFTTAKGNRINIIRLECPDVGAEQNTIKVNGKLVKDKYTNKELHNMLNGK